jgi:glycosyltransferase involved in cell wall biosynthesis
MGATSRGLRTCVVSYEFPPGAGEATYTYNVVRGMSDLGHTVFLVIPWRPGVTLPSLPGSTEVRYVKTRGAPLLRVAEFLLNAKAMLPPLISKEGIDVTHFTFDYPSLPLDFSGIGAPVLATVHHLHFVEAMTVLRHRRRVAMSPYFVRQFMLTKVEQRFVRRMERVIAVSEFTKRSLLQRGVPSERVVVVRNGVDTKANSEADPGLFRMRFGLQDRPFILFVGRLELSKGLEYLLSAYRIVRRRFPLAGLVLVGRGSPSYAAALKRSAAEAEDGVVFTGYVDAEMVASAYAAASLVVLPSLMEGMGIAILEAMAASKPCVASRIGGIPEVVEDGRTGFLVEPANAESLAEGIIRVLSDPSRARTMGEDGRRRAMDSFTIEQMSTGTQSAYLRAIEESSRAYKR